MTGADRPTVLAVDDEENVVRLYERFLADDFEVRVAETGEEALRSVDDDVDVVMLDRRLPDTGGEVVLERIRERDLDCRVAVVTAVDPDFDIIEMEFDDYLVKPVRERQVRETVDHLLARLRYTDLLTEYYRVASKVAALKAAKSEETLRANDEFVQLDERAGELRREVTSTLEELDDYESAFSEVTEMDVRSGD
jgi:DNA-binding response OmpR family regulator